MCVCVVGLFLKQGLEQEVCESQIVMRMRRESRRREQEEEFEVKVKELEERAREESRHVASR